MFRLFVHADAEADLERLWDDEPVAAARIAALLEELEGNQDLLDRLTQHDFGSQPSADFHVSKWQAFWKQRKDLWRLKIWALERRNCRYRVVYAFIPGKAHYYVLGIAPRTFNYEPTHELTQRILRAYEAL